MKTDLVVAVYAFNKDKLLLIHHKKLNLWLPPGGHIEKDETPDDACIREFEEETNLNIRLLHDSIILKSGNTLRNLAIPFYCNVHNVGDHDHSCSYYLAEILNPEELDPNLKEVHGIEWFSEKDLSQERVPADVRSIGLRAFELYNKPRES